MKFDELKREVDLIKQLLDDPQEGSHMWHIAVMEGMKRIADGFYETAQDGSHILAMIKKTRQKYGRDCLVWRDAQGDEHRWLDDADIDAHSLHHAGAPVSWGHATELPPA